MTTGMRMPIERVVPMASKHAAAMPWRPLRSAHTAPAPSAMNEPFRVEGPQEQRRREDRHEQHHGPSSDLFVRPRLARAPHADERRYARDRDGEVDRDRVRSGEPVDRRREPRDAREEGVRRHDRPRVPVAVVQDAQVVLAVVVVRGLDRSAPVDGDDGPEAREPPDDEHGDRVRDPRQHTMTAGFPLLDRTPPRQRPGRRESSLGSSGASGGPSSCSTTAAPARSSVGTAVTPGC